MGFLGISKTAAKLAKRCVSTKFINIKNYKISISQTHNLEVLGSSPSWSTLKMKQLRIS